ncbi:ABC transporter permease [Isoptericola sp. b490]|uniref:ABC transporter permease n=1 Tax=Actinotalea lenta TaxID=3064654 RepID=UPI002713D164|nr:ABC transporter permease [Isoptericola sp. b490]MDO8121814.1 ABC transporter permease [Isoptericola sp. b490]
MATTTLTRRVAAAPPLAPLAGTARLVRLALRRDRVLVPIWLAVFVVSAAGSAGATVGLYPTEASRVAVATTINGNPSFAALYGPILDPTSMGQVSLFKLSALGAALVGLLAVFLVARHTRAEEETGRTELLGAGVVGRWAPLSAALLVVVGTLVALALITAAALAAAGLDVVGSLSFGLSWLVTGLAFTGIAAVAAQVASTSRGTKGLAAGVLGLAYLVRAVADGSPNGDLVGLRWLSPVGWSQELHAFANPRWTVVGLAVVFAATTVALAYALVARRDLGAGLLPDRPGAATAPRSLAGPVGLVVRLNRGSLLGWALGAALLSMVMGGLVANISGFVDENSRPFFEALGGTQGIEDAFMAAEWSFIGVFFAAFAIATLLRLRGEESAGRAEGLLATPLTRRRWASAHLLAALGGAVVLLTVAGVFGAFSTVRATGDPGWWGTVLGAAVVQLPAIAVVVGLTLVAVAFLPRLAVGVSWGSFTLFLLLGEIGPLLRLPTWLLEVSPFAHTPRVPGETVSVAQLGGLTAVALVLLVAGLAGYRRRDLAT